MTLNVSFRSNAKSILSNMENITFYFCLRMFSIVFSLTTPAHLKLQNKVCTISGARDMVVGIKLILISWLTESNAVNYFSEFFEETKRLRLDSPTVYLLRIKKCFLLFSRIKKNNSQNKKILYRYLN